MGAKVERRQMGGVGVGVAGADGREEKDECPPATFRHCQWLL